MVTVNTKSKKKEVKLPKLTKEQKYFTEVDQLAQQKIYQLLTQIIPLPNIPLIKETWNYEDHQQKLSGLFLNRDADYRSLLSDVKSQSLEEEEWLDQEYLAEQITLWYCRMVVKSLISNLSDYADYDPSLFENLTSSEY